MELEQIYKNLLSNARAVVVDIANNNDISEIKQKSHQDYVTNLDVYVENYLKEHVPQTIENIPGLSEETIKDQIELPEEAIIIDPIDGTLNVIGEIPFYAISIAYLHNGVPKLGVTYDFQRDELFHAMAGNGFYINDKKVNPLSKELRGKLPIAISNNFLKLAAEKDTSVLVGLRDIARIRLLGSQTLHLAYVASGRLRADFDYEAKFWDDAAGYVMLKEMGISYVNFDGEEIFPKNILDPKENLKSLAASKEDLAILLKLTKGKF